MRQLQHTEIYQVTGGECTPSTDDDLSPWVIGAVCLTTFSFGALGAIGGYAVCSASVPFCMKLVSAGFGFYGGFTVGSVVSLSTLVGAALLF